MEYLQELKAGLFMHNRTTQDRFFHFLCYYFSAVSAYAKHSPAVQGDCKQRTASLCGMEEKESTHRLENVVQLLQVVEIASYVRRDHRGSFEE